MIAPPRPPSDDQLEALIREARARQRRRRVLGAVTLAVAAAISLGIYALLRGQAPENLVSPAEAGSASGPTCRASQLSVVVGLQGATQSLLGGADITNTSSAACLLPITHPSVRITLHGSVLAVRETPWPYRFTHGPVARVLPPRGRAVIDMQWWNWCGKTGVARMTLRFGRMLRVAVPQPVGEPTCISLPARNGSRLFISRAFKPNS